GLRPDRRLLRREFGLICRRERGTPRRCPSSPSGGRELALRVLGCLAGSLQTVLLALLHPRIAGPETGLAKRQAVGGLIDLDEGSRDAVTDRAGLAGDATALDLDHRVVVTLRSGHPERHPDVGFVHRVAEVLLEGSA